MKKRSYLLIALAVVLAIMLAACSGGDKPAEEEEPVSELKDWEYIQDKGILVVGVDDEYFMPMGFLNENNELVGFDIDYAREVAEVLGVDVEFQPIDWENKESLLASKQIDCVWNGMSVTPERQASMSLSNKYLNDRIVIMSANKNTDVQSAAELAYHSVGAQAGSAALEALQADPAYSTFAANVLAFETYDEVFQALADGTVDVIVIDEAYGCYISSHGQPMYTSTCSLGDDYYAIGFRKEDTELTKKVNDAFKTIKEYGRDSEISTIWFGKNLVIDEAYEQEETAPATPEANGEAQGAATGEAQGEAQGATAPEASGETAPEATGETAPETTEEAAG